MAYKGEAAIFLDSTPSLQLIIQKADDKEAGDTDVGILYTALVDRFPAQCVDDTGESLDSDDLEQGPGEPIAQYFNRVSTTLRRDGGRDNYPSI